MSRSDGATRRVRCRGAFARSGGSGYRMFTIGYDSALKSWSECSELRLGQCPIDNVRYSADDLRREGQATSRGVSI